VARLAGIDRLVGAAVTASLRLGVKTGCSGPTDYLCAICAWADDIYLNAQF
jgi:hypothetical protein